MSLSTNPEDEPLFLVIQPVNFEITCTIKCSDKTVCPYMGPKRDSKFSLISRKSSAALNTFIAEEPDMGRHCLCDTVKPIILMSQYLGVLPLALEHQKSDGSVVKRSEGVYCQLASSWKNIGAVVNGVFILFFAIILPMSYTEIRDRMAIVFSGTDLYAFTFQTLAMVLETTTLLTVNRIQKDKFSKV